MATIPKKLVYTGLKANLPSTREAGSFYLCTDTKELYFGMTLYTEAVRFCTINESTKPSPYAQGVLYIDSTTGDGYAHDGSAWRKVFSGTTGTEQQIEDAIEDALGELKNEDAEVSKQFVTAVKQEDGKITVTRKPLTAGDIPTIEQNQVNGLEDALADKADIGDDGDTADEDTIKGAKAYADHAVDAAKEELIGTAESASTSDTIKGAKKYTDEQIAAKTSSVYKPGGSKQFSELAALLANETVGIVYNISDANGFDTDVTFVEDAGKHYPAGTNVVCVSDSGSNKWDVLAGFVDLTDYAKSTQVAHDINAAKTALIGDEEGVSAETIQTGVKEAKSYADSKIADLDVTALATRVTAIESALTVGTFPTE